MKSVEFLTEAEQNVAKKKIDQQLDQLSNQEIDALLSMIDKSLDEGRFDYNPLAGSAPGQSKPQSTKPQQPKPQPKPQPQQQKKQPQQKKSEVRTYVDDLDNEQKETLKAVLQKEKEEREQTGEKVSKPTKSSGELKKWLQVMLVSIALGVGAGAFLGSKSTNTDIQKTTTSQKAEPSSKQEVKTPKQNAYRLADMIYDLVIVKGYSPNTVKKSIDLVVTDYSLKEAMYQMAAEAFSMKRKLGNIDRQTYRDTVWVVMMNCAGGPC